MEFFKIAIIIVTSVFVIACGGKDDPKEIIFPEHLPKINPNLNNDNPVGIWMVYRKSNSRSEIDNSIAAVDIYTQEIITNELVMIEENKHDYYHLRDCTARGVTPDFDFETSKSMKNGYTRLYRSHIAEEFGESGQISTYFLNNQKIYGKGWKVSERQPPDNSYVIKENIEFFAVKVSDEANFITNNELNYSGSLTSDISGDRYIEPLCIGLQKHLYSSASPEKETGFYHAQYFTLFGIFSPGFVIYNGKSSNSEEYIEEDNQIIGVQQTWLQKTVDNFCYSSDLECVNKYSFQSEIFQNDAAGISFSAKLTGNEALNNEIYVDTEISAIIHPVEYTDNNQ